MPDAPVGESRPETSKIADVGKFPLPRWERSEGGDRQMLMPIQVGNAEMGIVGIPAQEGNAEMRITDMSIQVGSAEMRITDMSTQVGNAEIAYLCTSE